MSTLPSSSSFGTLVKNALFGNGLRLNQIWINRIEGGVKVLVRIKSTCLCIKEFG